MNLGENRIKTVELAKIYEDQGHFQDALDIYQFLNSRLESGEITVDEMKAEAIRDGLDRMKHKVQEMNSSTETPISQLDIKKQKVSALLEKWLNLLILQQRLDNFKRVKARF